MKSISEEIAYNVYDCLTFIVSLLMWPVPLVTLIVLGHRCYQNKIFIDALPLLATQLISAFIWVCTAISRVGYFTYGINRTHFI